MRDRNTLFTNINIGGVGGGCMGQVARIIKYILIFAFVLFAFIWIMLRFF